MNMCNDTAAMLTAEATASAKFRPRSAGGPPAPATSLKPRRANKPMREYFNLTPDAKPSMDPAPSPVIPSTAELFNLTQIEQLFRQHGGRIIPPFMDPGLRQVFPEGHCYQSNNNRWTNVTVWNYPGHQHEIDPECALSGLYNGHAAAMFGCQYAGKQRQHV